MSENAQTFEQRLEAVQRIIEGIESGKLPLEEAVRQYEAGIQNLNALEKELSDMKRRITVLQEQRDGTLAEEALEESE